MGVRRGILAWALGSASLDTWACDAPQLFSGLAPSLSWRLASLRPRRTVLAAERQAPTPSRLSRRWNLLRSKPTSRRPWSITSGRTSCRRCFPTPVRLPCHRRWRLRCYSSLPARGCSRDGRRW